MVPSYHTVPLIGSYENRSNQSYIAANGDAVFDCVSVIPSGVVCFFPSYR